MTKVKKSALKLKTVCISKGTLNNVKVDGKSLHKVKEEKKRESKLKRLKMYRTKANLKKMNTKINEVRRLEPCVKWFNNTRTISQNKLEIFRDKLEESNHDPFSVIIKRSKIPLELLKDEKECVTKKFKNENFLRIENFDEVFSKQKKRKRPKLNVSSLEEFSENANKKLAEYETQNDILLLENKEKIEKKNGRDILLKVGQSGRIWNELYKVIDSSDVILEIVDARDPIGTRCRKLEKNLKKTHPNKHIIIIINKIDLIPTSIADQWVKIFSKEYPTIVYHADINNPFGKNELFNIIRQYGSFFKEKKSIQVGLIGYPNVGKSAIINSLKKKKVCISASIPGQTKYWQFVKLTTKIYIIDCPGIVPLDTEESEKVLRCTMRVEKIPNPDYYIENILKVIDKSFLLKLYKLPENMKIETTEEFLKILAKKKGKLLKMGVPDIVAVSKIILNDWIKGKIPYFIKPDKNLLKMENEEKSKKEDQEEVVKEERGNLDSEKEEEEEEEDETEKEKEDDDEEEEEEDETEKEKEDDDEEEEEEDETEKEKEDDDEEEEEEDETEKEKDVEIGSEETGRDNRKEEIEYNEGTEDVERKTDIEGTEDIEGK